MWPILLLFLPSVTLGAADKSPCKVCRDLTSHFNEHFENTKGHNFGGGNTAWEEKSLGSYTTSETRLVEILEKAAKKCDYKCSSLLEDQEEWLEEWFFKRQDTDLFEELCVMELQRCCTKNRWGPDCAECPGGTETPCSGHGRCQDEGDRKTNGKLSGTCMCDNGYNGTLCEGCKARFVRIGDNCEECSSLCEGGCVEPGPAGCVACKKGYEKAAEDGSCVDIDECTVHGCGDPLEDCLNSPGTYECVCKAGYSRVQGKCQLEELYASENEEDEGEEEASTAENLEESGDQEQSKESSNQQGQQETLREDSPTVEIDESLIPALQEAKRKVKSRPVSEGGSGKKKKEDSDTDTDDDDDDDDDDGISLKELRDGKDIHTIRDEL